MNMMDIFKRLIFCFDKKNITYIQTGNKAMHNFGRQIPEIDLLNLI
jgi:hypothetical protein